METINKTGDVTFIRAWQESRVKHANQPQKIKKREKINQCKTNTDKLSRRVKKRCEQQCFKKKLKTKQIERRDLL